MSESPVFEVEIDSKLLKKKHSSNLYALYMVYLGLSEKKIYQIMKKYYRLLRGLLAPGQGGRGLARVNVQIF